MKASPCLFNSAVALRKVFFIGNGAASEAPGQLQRLLLPALTAPLPPSPSPLPPSTRPFSTHPVAQYKYTRVTPPTGPAAPSPERQNVHNHAIPYSVVQLRREDSTLTLPQKTALILKKLDLSRYMLVLLARPRAEDATKGPEHAICQIMDRNVLKAVQAEKEAAKKKTVKITNKELEINWAIAPNDMRTRMLQLKRFLSKGYAVQVTLLNVKKRDKRRASTDEAKQALKTVRDTVAEVPGAKETKPMEGNVGDTVVLSLHAPTGSVKEKATEDAASAASGATAAVEESVAQESAPEGPTAKEG
ncbi:hypothetical protein N0V88_001303 [Collariella sp. IMI 366227]|nr:hypothetical protein N0V88_001303 [Collariella sp. IMI 366227]